MAHYILKEIGERGTPAVMDGGPGWNASLLSYGDEWQMEGGPGWKLHQDGPSWKFQDGPGWSPTFFGPPEGNGDVIYHRLMLGDCPGYDKLRFGPPENNGISMLH